MVNYCWYIIYIFLGGRKYFPGKGNPFISSIKNIYYIIRGVYSLNLLGLIVRENKYSMTNVI